MTTTALSTAGLLLVSNVFMTFAWYGHLRFKSAPLIVAILASWGIAFFEYCLQVPANRLGFAGGISGFQLKMLQEVITLVVFTVFAIAWLKETPRWNHGAAALCLLGAVYFTFLHGDPRSTQEGATDAAGRPTTENP